MPTLTTERLSRAPARLTDSKKFSYWSLAMPLFFVIWLSFLLWIEPQPIHALSQNWSLMLVGFAASLVANISAIGGGIVFIPAMMFIYHVPALLALKAALGTQCIGLTIGSVSWLRTGLVPVRGFRFALAGLLIGSTVSSLVIHANAMLIKAVFGPVSILLGCLALLSLGKGSNVRHDDIPDSARWTLFWVSIFGGLITGWVSIGEGEVVAAFLMLAYGVSAKRSIALGVALLAINSLYLTFNHIIFLGGIPWNIAIFTIGGAMYGAWMTPSLSRWLSARMMKIIFANIAILDGCLFIYQSGHGSH